MEDSIIKKIRIAKIISETEDSKTFVLEPMDGWSPVYQAGQFLTLVFNTHYGEKRRSFSISSSPGLREPLSVTIKKLDNGEFSRLLHNKSKVGDILFTSGISGFFKLPEDLSDKKYFFLAAGSGITPCYSLIKTLLFTTGEKVVLVYSNRSQRETIFYNELKKLQAQYKDRFVVRFFFSNANDFRQKRLNKALLEELLHAYLPENKLKAWFYLCGPVKYMLMAAITLRSNDIPARQMIREDFSPAPRTFMPVPPDIRQHEVTIHINEHTYMLKVQYPKTILATARDNKIVLPYSCDAGRCGSCVAKCTSGKIWMAYNEVLMEEEISKGLVLTCVGYPIEGNAEIFFDTDL